jgi:hypothetical protein
MLGIDFKATAACVFDDVNRARDRRRDLLDLEGDFANSVTQGARCLLDVLPKIVDVGREGSKACVKFGTKSDLS